MKKTVLRFGLYALITGFIFFGLPFFLGMGVDYDYGELIGYTSIVLSLLFVFFGIKYYRDRENNGKVTFARALGIGMFIALFSAIGVAIMDFVYTTQINPDFVADYSEYYLNKLQQSGISAEEYKTKSTEFKQQMEAYGSPSFMAFMMFGTVIIIGFIISLVSGLILQRK
ncbi:DUF4199 domain-containing protein [Winogradskyella flava]|uniref:DUF4199 domain-containing protein n=1 Tax=Winogradskyella flava TaxID=1884876 RepID=A0A842IRN7_9FLAO|nr:DUF4199 domain-containing protein [Winogradskyella flava]MBC2844107.1 DUF4199 domain-containing protein [Winogradskyella flava]